MGSYLKNASDTTKANAKFQTELLQGLLEDAEQGRNRATLEIRCADSSNPLFLHRSIAVRSTAYFASRSSFKESDFAIAFQNANIDAATFRECRKFMYLGKCNITHENVVALLEASTFLLMQPLQDDCWHYLEANLDHSNQEVVKETAERYDKFDLQAYTMRFKTIDEAKTQVRDRKLNLAEKIRHEESLLQNTQRTKLRLMDELEQLEEQWTDLMQKDLDRVVVSSSSAEDEDEEAAYPYVKAKQLGAVARLVVDPKNHHTCRGRSEYDPNAASSQDPGTAQGGFFGVSPLPQPPQAGFGLFGPPGPPAFGFGLFGPPAPPAFGFGMHPSSPKYGQPPPPPTQYDFEELGIVCTYASLEEALKDSKPGDRIYLQNGKHNTPLHDFKQSQEILAYPGHSPLVHVFDNPFSSPWKVRAGSLRVQGLTFDYEHSGGSLFRGSKASALVEFSSEEGCLWIQDCTFNLGTNAATAQPSRVSGVRLMQAEFAVIERNKFIGGGGSSVAILNDPLLFVSHVVIRHNIFINAGQPSFSEQKTREVSDTEESPLAEDEIAPGPAAVELWRLNRQLYTSTATQLPETYKTTTCILSGNQFRQCMRAGLAYRAISGVRACYRDVYSQENPRPKPSAQLCTDPSIMSTVATGYDLALNDNVFVDNGLEFTREKIAGWIPVGMSDDDSHNPRPAKRSRTDGYDNDCGGTSMSVGLATGQSLLVIKQIAGPDDGFPEGFDESIPCSFYQFREHCTTS